MATIAIGGRALDVKECTIGMLKRKVRPLQAEMGEQTQPLEVLERVVQLLLVFVGHNEGVTAEWLEDNVAVHSDVLSRTYEASGLVRREDPPAGEAQSR